MTLMLIFAEPIVIDIAQLKKAVRVGGQPLFNQQPVSAYSDPPQAIQEAPVPFEPVDHDASQPLAQAQIEWPEANKPRATEVVQNVYNDKSYIPKPPQNTFSPPAYSQAPTQQVAARLQSGQSTLRETDGR